MSACHPDDCVHDFNIAVIICVVCKNIWVHWSSLPVRINGRKYNRHIGGVIIENSRDGYNTRVRGGIAHAYNADDVGQAASGVNVSDLRGVPLHLEILSLFRSSSTRVPQRAGELFQLRHEPWVWLRRCPFALDILHCLGWCPVVCGNEVGTGDAGAAADALNAVDQDPRAGVPQCVRYELGRSRQMRRKFGERAVREVNLHARGRRDGRWVGDVSVHCGEDVCDPELREDCWIFRCCKVRDIEARDDLRRRLC